MKYLPVLLLLFLVACDEENKPNPHLTDYTSKKSGGFILPNGDYAKFEVTSNEESIHYDIEVSKNGRCWLGKGSANVRNVREIEKEKENGRYTPFQNLIVQTLPEYIEGLEANYKFVHFVVQQNPQSQSRCTGAAGEIVDETEYSELLSRSYFSGFELEDWQKKLAGEAFLNGSTKKMILFREVELGAVLDSVTQNLIGISVPKHVLKTGFVYTTNIGPSDVINIPKDTLFPLVFDESDEALFHRARSVAKQYAAAIDESAHLSEERRRMLLGLIWSDFFKTQKPNEVQQ